MNVQEKAIKKLKDDIKKKEIFDDKISTLISDLYQERHLEIEREKKVLLDRFILSTEGKGIVLENRL
jgi:isopropylmalate/homocitrate/citramalate synthase